MTPLRILLTNASDIYGGGEFFVYTLADSLTKRGRSVYVSCRKDNLLYKKCTDSGIKVFPVDYPSNNFPQNLIRVILTLKKFIAENKIDIVHTNTNYDRTAGAFAAKLGSARHVASVHSSHSIQHNFTHWLRNRKLTDHFIVSGKNTRELLTEHDSINGNKISLIYLGIDPEAMKRDFNMRNEIRASYGITDKNILIGNVGRMVEFKGQEYLIKSFPNVLSNFPDARLMIVGSGKLENELHSLTQSLDIKEQVIFPGFRSEMQEIYSAFDIYAHTSIEGGGELLPYAVLYALAQKLPLVVTNVGDISAAVEEGVNGYLIKDGDNNAITDKLSILLKDFKLRENMGKAGFDLLKREFTTDIMTDKIEKVYQKVMNYK
ncbi:MAG: glycosyltransferase family 4 protein [Ignavibacteria bacterium]